MHSTTMSEVQAELESLVASTPKFKKIETPEFGVEALALGPPSNSAPMDTGKPNFPILAGSCGDCGHANVGMPPPGLYTPLPSHGALDQVTLRDKDMSPSENHKTMLRILQDHPVDNELEEIFPTMMTMTMTTVLDQVDFDTLKALGRPIAECLREEIKIKKQGVPGGASEEEEENCRATQKILMTSMVDHLVGLDDAETKKIERKTNLQNKTSSRRLPPAFCPSLR
eukprot:6457567-Amphidinium_carterae.1